jgi:hypothetical protein
MAAFIFKRNNQEITLDSLPPGPVKDSFENLMNIIGDQLHSLTCEKHHLEPVVMLQTDGKKVTVAGFGTCCREFTLKIKNLMKLPEGAMEPDATFTIREFSYLHGS